MNKEFHAKTISVKNPDNLVYLDIETSGLDSFKGAKIIEIAMLKIKSGKQEQYETLINPGSPIPDECSRINSIYDYMVSDSPSFKDIALDVLKFIGNDTIVCHNAEFDLSFISKELFDNFQVKNKFYYIDTLKIARQYFNFESNALGRLAGILGISVESSHRAMADVMTMYRVSKYLFENLFRKGIDTIEPLQFG